MSIEAAQRNFGLFKSTAQGEFAKTRHAFEQAADQGGVDAVVGQIAQRLDTTPAIALQLLKSDGWTSAFEQNRPKAEREMMDASGTLNAPVNFGAEGLGGRTVSHLGGFKDWNNDVSADAFVAQLKDNRGAMMKMFSLAGASMSSKLRDLRAVPDADGGFRVTADLVNFMTQAKESEVTFLISADMKKFKRVHDQAPAAHFDVGTLRPGADTPPAAHWLRAATPEETAFTATLKDNESVMQALFMANGGDMSSNIANVDARKVGDGWEVKADVVNFMTRQKNGTAHVQLDAAGAVI